MKLTNQACKNAKPAAKPYKLTDGAGLYLLVKPTGSKLWQMKYTFAGNEKTFSVGMYPLIGLADARIARDEAKRLLQQSIDPTEAKNVRKVAAIRKVQNTFQATALEWYETKKGVWSASHAANVLHRLETDIFPSLGKRPLSTIKTPDVLDALRKVEQRGALDLAVRTRQICNQVFCFGMQVGRCDHNPADALRGALKTRKTVHYKAIMPDELPELIRAIQRNDARLYPSTRNAILLSLLTFQRPTEIREARWSEIDLEKGMWVIPSVRMKKAREHIVPLSRQAVAVLRQQKKETGLLDSDWVFPSVVRAQQAMSNNTVRVALHKLGFKGRMTAHGFRALARTAIREALDYPPDVIEVQLAHKAAGPLGEAYNRSQFLKRRTVMMQDWADYIDSVSGLGEVIYTSFFPKKAIRYE